MLKNIEEPLFKCAYLLKIEEDEFNIFRKSGNSSYSLALKVPYSKGQIKQKLTSALNDLPNKSEVCVILANSMSHTKRRKYVIQSGFAVEGRKSISIVPDDLRNTGIVKFEISKNTISKMIEVVEAVERRLTISLLLRVPSVSFPYSIYIETARGMETEGSVLSRISCFKNDGVFLVYSKGIILSGLDKSVQVPLSTQNSAPIKSIMLHIGRKFKNLNHPAFGKLKSTLFPIVVGPSKRINSKLNSEIVTPKAWLSIFHHVNEFFISKILTGGRTQSPSVDIIVINDEFPQTAFFAATAIKNSLTSDCVVEMGAFRATMRSSFSSFFAAAVVVETNNLPLSDESANATIHSLMQKTKNDKNFVLVLGKELTENPSFQNLLTSLCINYHISSISVFGYDVVMAGLSDIDIMKAKCKKVSFVVCGKREASNSIQAFPSGVRIIEFPNINLKNPTDAERQKIKLD